MSFWYCNNIGAGALRVDVEKRYMSIPKNNRKSGRPLLAQRRVLRGNTVLRTCVTESEGWETYSHIR
jgi:hypothetical protein